MSKQTCYRLIALWALSEAMLGGIVHGLNIPVSGLLVGSCSVTCISLLAWYVPEKGAILKATIIVAIFKMLLSPHSPPPAYIAVFFQGILGELLFRKDKKFFRFSCILFASLTLLESGLQRILVLTIIYGNDVWKVLNDFINGLTRQQTPANYSLLIGTVYVFLHLFTGLVVGAWVSSLPGKIEKWRTDRRNTLLIEEQKNLQLPAAARKRKRQRKGILVIWLLLTALYIQSYYKIGTPLLPAHVSLKILLRSLIIVFTWIFIAGPLLKQALEKWLHKKQTQSKQDIQAVVELLPLTRQLVAKSWKQTADVRGMNRVNEWIKLVLVNALAPSVIGADKELVLLVAPVQTGKTSSLVSWSADRSDVHGILTPIVDGKRMFMDAHSRQIFLMEARDGEPDTIATGRYVFSRSNFEKAISVIRQAMHKEGWLVIDEVGPLELTGEGFSEVVKELLEHRREKTILVIRDKEGMIERVKKYFGIDNAVVIGHTGAL